MRYVISLLFSFSCFAIVNAQVEKDDFILSEPQEQEDTFISDHVTVYPSELTGSRNVNCDCWVEPDEDYTLFSNTNMDDGSTGNLALPFTFELFGTDYTSFWLNINGHITFDAIPSGFFVDADFPLDRAMIAPCHSDVDLTCGTCGDIYYKVTDDAVYINWVDVGHFDATSDQVQNFQMIFTSNTSTLLGDGNNVQFCYRDMQWTETNSSNTVEIGASAGNGIDYIQFGVFEDENNSDYDGPFDNNDGIDWLDNKTISFNSSLSSTDNTPPISVGASECDTIRLCIDDTEALEFAFLAPEDNQTVNIVIDDGGFTNLTSTIVPGNYTIANLLLSSDGVAPGFYNLTVTATDDGVPAQSTTVSITVEVIAVAIPDLDIYYEDEIVSTVSFCAGQPQPMLTGTDGFECYTWTNGLTEQSGEFGQGTYSLEAFFMGCEANAGPISVFEIPVFNPDVSVVDPFLCEGETTQISIDNPEDYNEFGWSVFLGNGEIISTDLGNDTITVTPGFYEVSVIDMNDCAGFTIVPVTLEIINLPVPEVAFPLAQCDDYTVSWSGAWADPNDCTFTIFMSDSEGDTWEGANISVYVDGAGPFNYNINSPFTFVADGVEVFHGQVVEYFWTSGLDDDDITVQIFDSDNNSVFNTAGGDVLTDGTEPFLIQTADCGFNALPGVWTDEPAVGTFTNPNVYNPVNAAQNYTVPDDYIGTIILTFTSTVCDFVDEVEISFAIEPTVMTTDYESCEGVPVVVTPTYGPDNVDLEGCFFDWTPNFSSDGNQTATVNNTVNYTIEISNDCGSDEASGTVTFIPIPGPSLNNAALCDGATTTLNPLDDHPSYVYDWSTGSIESEITVSEDDTYTVTVTNECGEGTAQADITTGQSPVVNFWANDTILCSGSEILVNPTWANVPASGPVAWSLSYLDVNNDQQLELYENNASAFTLGSDMVPGESNSDIILSYNFSNICGSAAGSVVILPDVCFIDAYNIITPDNDGSEFGSDIGGVKGLNEGWQIIGIDGVSNVKVQIFDRWGGLVYEDDSYLNSNPWMGDDKNDNALEDGVYFYTVYVPRGDKELTGTVTIFRKE